MYQTFVNFTISHHILYYITIKKGIIRYFDYSFYVYQNRDVSSLIFRHRKMGPKTKSSVKLHDINRLFALPSSLSKFHAHRIVSSLTQRIDICKLRVSFQAVWAAIPGLQFQVKILIIESSRFPGSLTVLQGITCWSSGTRAIPFSPYAKPPR